MTDPIPRFAEPTPIDATRSWTAEFDSYDQRNDDLYYVVTTHDGDRPTARFMVRVFAYGIENWLTPEFVGVVRDALHRAAEQGRTNTDYQGPLANGG